MWIWNVIDAGVKKSSEISKSNLLMEQSPIMGDYHNAPLSSLVQYQNS